MVYQIKIVMTIKPPNIKDKYVNGIYSDMVDS